MPEPTKSTVAARTAKPRVLKSGFKLAGWRFLELLGLYGITVTQFVLDLYGRSPEEFINRRMAAGAVVEFALLVALAPPLLMSIAVAAVDLVSSKASSIVQRVLLGGLVGLSVIQLAGRSIGPPLSVVIALAAIAAAAWLLIRTQVVNVVARFMSIGSVFFVMVFLFSSGVTPLVLDEARATEVALDVEFDTPRPIVLLLFDELPVVSLLDGDGHVDADRFPAFAEVERSSVWFRNTTTVADQTIQAFPAIVTGAKPKPVLNYAALYPNNLFTFLGGTYTMNVQEPVSRLCPEDLCVPYTTEAGSMEGLVRDAADLWADPVLLREPPDVTDGVTERFYFPPDIHDEARFERFIDDLTASRSPRLHFLHSIFPHLPFEFTPEGRVCTDGYQKLPRGVAKSAWTSEYAADSGRARHLAQVEYTDAWLQVMIDKMKAEGLWDEAIIIITADHGMSFTQGPLRDWDQSIADQVLFVPMFIRAPELDDGTIDDSPSSMIDLVPTIADLAGGELPYEVLGTSLFEDRTEGFDQSIKKMDWAPFDRDDAFERVLKAEAVPAGGELGVYKTGTGGAWVGKSVDAYALDEPSALTASLDKGQTGLTRTFDPSQRDLDCYVSAKLSAPRDKTMAVALNGVIATVLAPDPATRDLWALLPEPLFVEGDNTVTLWEFDKVGRKTVLREVGVKS